MQKSQHVNGPSAITKPNADACVFFLCNCPEMRANVLDQHAADEMRRCEARFERVKERRCSTASVTLAVSND